MAQHIKLLAVLHIVFGALGILGALLVMTIGGGLAGFVAATDADADGVAGSLMAIISAVITGIILLLSVPHLIAGVGLLRFRPWARILAIVVSCVELFNVPFGTALGVYGLWALLSKEAVALFGESGSAVPGSIANRAQ